MYLKGTVEMHSPFVSIVQVVGYAKIHTDYLTFKLLR